SRDRAERSEQMDEPTTQGCMTTSDATIHTVPLAGEDRVLVLVEANSHVTHVISLTTDGARQMVVGLLDALDVVALCADDDACGR
ncbi:MAG: hypothetical protein ACRD0D_15600, partial [Acidimicrobiales bacterium]